MTIEQVVQCAKQNNTEQILPIIHYLKTQYPAAHFDEYNSEKTRIPTWRFNNNYVGIGCRKHYISVYFSQPSAAQTVAQHTPYCRALKACVNFSYKRELPLQAIYKGIDACFST